MAIGEDNEQHESSSMAASGEERACKEEDTGEDRVSARVSAVPNKLLLDDVAVKSEVAAKSKTKGSSKIMDPSIVERFCLDDTSQGGEDRVIITSLRQQEGLQSHMGPGAYPFGADIPESAGQGQQPPQELETDLQPPEVVEDGLVVAMPVEDDSKRMTEAVEWQERPSNRYGGKTRGIQMLVCLVGLILLIVVPLVALLSTRSNKEQATVDAADSNLSKGSMDKHVMSLLPEYTLAVLEDAKSPQAYAYDWILQDPALPSYASWRIQQRFALATLYFSTHGPGWNKADDWLSYDHHECQWHRSFLPWKLVKSVVPDSDVLEPYWEYPICSDEGAYKQIQLYTNDLQGTLPPELSLLSSLISLMVNSNVLTGTLPTELAELPQLEVLTLAGNEFTGTFPSQYGLFTDLKAFGLFHTQIRGSIPSELGLLKNVEGFNMGLNALTGSLPSELARMERVERLRFDNNYLTGTIPTELCQLTSLEILRLDQNELTGSIPSEFGDFEKISRMYLGSNLLEGSIPAQVGVWELVSHFDVSENPMLSGRIPTNFCGQAQVLFNCTESLCGCDCGCTN